MAASLDVRRCPICNTRFTVDRNTGHSAWKKHLASCRARRRKTKNRKAKP